MRLSRALRNNGRVLILVFMSLLLVSFLIQDVLSYFTRGGTELHEKKGSAFGRDIYSTDLLRVRSELGVLQRLGLFPFEIRDEALLNVYLVLAEAEHMGVHVGIDEVKQELIDGGVTDAHLAELQRTSGLKYDDIYAIAARWKGLTRIASLLGESAGDSLPREARSYLDQEEEAVVRLSVLDARAFLSAVPDPSEAELAAFFDEAKGRAPVQSEDEWTPGYLYPNRVQVEYVTIDPIKLLDHVQVRELQMRRWFEQYKNDYMKPKPSTQPTSQPSAEKEPMTYEEAAERVREDLRRQTAIEQAQRVMNEIAEEARRPWHLRERDAEGFRLAPDGPPISFEELAKKYSEKSGYEVEYHKTELLDSAGLSRERDFGQAAVREGTGSSNAIDLAMRVKGLFNKEKDDALSVLNILEPAPLAMTQRFDRFAKKQTPYKAILFRVSAISASSPPATLDEVRKKVVDDWKLMKAAEIAKSHAEKLAARAREIGLDAAVAEAADLKLTLAAADTASTQPAASQPAPPPRATDYVKQLDPMTPMGRFTRRMTFIQNLRFPSQALPREIFVAATQPASAPASAPASGKCIVVKNAAQAKFIVAELREMKPVYQGAFDRRVVDVVKGMAAAQRQQNTLKSQAMYSWLFDGEAVQKRTGFVSAQPEPAKTETRKP